MNLLGSVNSEIHKKSGEYHKFLFKPFQFYMYDNEITYPMIASWWVSWVSACDSSSRGSCWISGCRRFQTLTGCAIVVPTVSRGGVVGLTAVTSIPTLNSDWLQFVLCKICFIFETKDNLHSLGYCSRRHNIHHQSIGCSLGHILARFLIRMILTNQRMILKESPKIDHLPCFTCEYDKETC